MAYTGSAGGACSDFEGALLGDYLFRRAVELIRAEAHIGGPLLAQTLASAAETRAVLTAAEGLPFVYNDWDPADPLRRWAPRAFRVQKRLQLRGQGLALLAAGPDSAADDSRQEAKARRWAELCTLIPGLPLATNTTVRQLVHHAPALVWLWLAGAYCCGAPPPGAAPLPSWVTDPVRRFHDTFAPSVPPFSVIIHPPPFAPATARLDALRAQMAEESADDDAASACSTADGSELDSDLAEEDGATAEGFFEMLI